MVYRVIGVSCGQSMDGLDIICTEFTEIGGKWSYAIIAEETALVNDFWKEQLAVASKMAVLEYQLLHTAFGQFIGEQVNHFIHHHSLAHTIQLIALQGYTLFHLPERKISAQLGHGAFIAAVTKLPVVSDLCSLDMAFGGRGEPLNAITSKLLQSENSSLPLTVALLGVLRWREGTTLLGSSSGAERDSIGGAMWLGTEA